MKIVFLDIDGVLCTHRSCVRQQGLMQILDTVAVSMLAKMLIETKAKLVLSSTWRLHHDQQSMTAILQNAGMYDVPWHQNWKTPELSVGGRGDEIYQWCLRHGTPEKYCIIDDDRDMLPEQMPSYVNCRSWNGFMWEDYTLAMKILGGTVL